MKQPDRRDGRMVVRLNREERELLEHAARRENRTVGQYLRHYGLLQAQRRYKITLPRLPGS